MARFIRQWVGGPKLVALIVASFLLMATSNANATLTVTLSDGVNPLVTVADGGIGDTCALVGCVTFSGAIGAWIANVTTGFSKPLIGPDILDLNSVNATSSAGGTLTIQLSDDNFLASQDGSIGWDTTVGGTQPAGGTVTVQAWVNPNNVLFAHQGSVAGPLLFTTPSYSAAVGGSTLPLFAGEGFSATIQAVITHTGAGTTSFDIATQVPEPGTLSLLGMGLIAAVGVARRRK